MFELEALFLGIEPVTALAVGAGALILVPVAAAVDSVTGSKLSEGARSTAKNGLVMVFEAFDKVQHTFAEASESVQDLIAEARAEIVESKNGTEEKSPREVTIG